MFFLWVYNKMRIKKKLKDNIYCLRFTFGHNLSDLSSLKQRRDKTI